MSSLYTVVLKRPTSISVDDDPDTDIYVAIGLRAHSIIEAVRKAKNEAFTSDSNQDLTMPALDMEGITAASYKLLVVFAGEHPPVLFGWQPH